MILRNAPTLSSTDGLLDQTKAFWMLIYVKERPPRDLPNSDEAEPPIWPPSLANYPTQLVYDLSVVPLSSIAIVTRATQKVSAAKAVSPIRPDISLP